MTARARSWLGYGGLWILLGLYYATWDFALYPSMAVWRVLALNLSQNAAWGLLGLLLLALAERFPLESFGWEEWRTWLLHGAAAVVVACAGLVVAYLLALLLGEHTSPMQIGWFFKGLKRFFASYFHTNLLLMVAVLGGFHAFRIHQRLRAREVEGARLEARFAEAQHRALRMQLQPHFLFNTLNSVSALVHSDPEAADRMIGRLGDFLRMTLDAPPDQEVSLRKELAFIEAYLSIERIRFGDRLKVIQDIPPELHSAKVPAFILQPLVENALKHGLADRPEGGTITLRARRDSDCLVLEVQDDGEGFRPGREGTGLANVRARLGLLHGGRAELEILTAPRRGTLVALRLPLA